MFNPEYYIGSYRKPDGALTTTKYTDEDSASASAALQGEHHFWERRPLYCVPVPHEAPWSADRVDQQHPSAIPSTPSGARPLIAAPTVLSVSRVLRGIAPLH
jgi:hypothetical protein